VLRLLAGHIETHGLDLVCVGPMGFVLEREPDTVRGPDVSLVRASRVPPPHHSGYIDAAPDLVVEILSPSNKRREVQDKVRDYQGAGAGLIWVVDPPKRLVVVHAPGTPARTLAGDDVLDGGDVVPGFRLPLAQLFAG
jgi:Uma2 family endonuclease